MKFYFDMYPEKQFEGMRAGGTWNGFDNVKVTPQVAAEIDTFFVEIANSPDEIDELLADLPRDADGMINLSGGYTTVIA